tara:strand:+ start:344 stop:658 length:315 start_codon:yes stop_codon:yes gene_type:complete
MSEETAPEDSKEPEETTRRSKSEKPITFQEVKETIVEVKGEIAELLGEPVTDLLGMYARRARMAVGGALAGLAGKEPVTACEVIKADGAVCGRPAPCRYHGGGE